MIGQTLGHYRIIERIGAGGMGLVYRAHDERLGRDVALKVLPAGALTDDTARARLLREARTASTLNHPHICTIYEVGDANGQTYIAMEFIQGRPLSALVTSEGLPVETVLRYGAQSADALAHAHERGVVHRDLKSANVIITPEGRAKVLDFGLAKRLSGEDLDDVTRSQASLTLPGALVGTLAYMAPEQLRGRPADARSDIWALGVMLYEMATGRRPFRGDTAYDLSAAILREPPPPLPSKVPLELRAVVERCLAKQPEHRYQQAGEVRAVLEALASSTTAAPTLPVLRFVSRRWLVIGATLLILLGLLLAATVWLRQAARLADSSKWIPLTKFPDSVGQPALSPDGRMLTFVRGPGTFYTPGQIYLKLLPDGEPKELTHDDNEKMSPVFSPDGSRIAYTTVDDHFKWDTWLLPTLGGEARRWLPNASGLVWRDNRTVLFSEMKAGAHMAIVTAQESRAGARDVYVPAREEGMAHRSYPSPDGKWALVVEMDGPWIPCRLVPLDGSSPGQQVGPPEGACTFAAWSPDGTWMYFSSSAGGAFHIWRQRFPNGKPEQITSGPTEEEGIAMAPDGGSLITAVGQKQRPVMLHQPGGERQISLEGYGFNLKFTPDGKTLCYRLLKGSQPASDATELWVADVDSGRNEPLLPGFSLLGLLAYDISPDGTEVVVSVRDSKGKDRLWLAPMDRRSPPRQIPNIEGVSPIFGLQGEVFFRSADGFVYRVREDGTGLRKIIQTPIGLISSISPDGRWLVTVTGDTFVHPIGGGPIIHLGGLSGAMATAGWTPDRRHFVISAGKGGMRMKAEGNTYIIPLSPGRMLPKIPAGGFQSRAQIARLPGVREIDAADVAFGRRLDTYAYSRETAQRNLYRIPLQ